MSKLDSAIKNWNGKSEYETGQILRHNSIRYETQARHGLHQPPDPLDPSEPLYPLKRRPKPKRPFEVLQNSLKAASEPLVDIFEDERVMKIYFEVRGADQKNIQLNITRSNVQVKNGGFFKTVSLPQSNVDLENASSKFKNGVLEITIPKKERRFEKGVVRIEIS